MDVSPPAARQDGNRRSRIAENAGSMAALFRAAWGKLCFPLTITYHGRHRFTQGDSDLLRGASGGKYRDSLTCVISFDSPDFSSTWSPVTSMTAICKNYNPYLQSLTGAPRFLPKPLCYLPTKS